ncbi:MAG: PD-(D/E)XK nuclease family protein [Bacteroidales bacterium]|nr:PD-(D/E)XK nuclease family protein [Bacteroidales bacterium]
MRFLQQVALYYIQKAKEGKANLGHYTFVMPNKRSAMFLRRYLKDYASATAFQPRIITITNFTQEFCDTQLCEPLELLYILYRAYRKVKDADAKTGEILDFDAFVHWGAILLNDFNEIDAYMVEADQLFENIVSEHEIRSSFLSPAQCQAARALGLSVEQAEKSASDFWLHTQGTGKAKQQFVHRWELLGPIYKEFKKLLAEQNFAYSGQQSQQAYLTIKELGAAAFRGRRFAFIGFNVLSTARYLIFKKLFDLGIAEFFWDIAFIQTSPTMPKIALEGNNAGEMVASLSKHLPAPDDFILNPILTYPEINIYPVPSNVAQAKMASNIIKLLPNPSTVDTGIILPNSDLMVPLLYSIPAKVDTINIAMKVPYANTPFWTLMNIIIAMHERSKIIRGELYYFHKDVLEVLSHPYMALISPNGCVEIKEEIIKSNYYNVPTAEIASILDHCKETTEKPEIINGLKRLEMVFKPVTNVKDIDEVHDYLSDLLDSLYKALSEKQQDKASSPVTPYELTVLEAYSQQIDKIFQLAKKHRIQMSQNTFFSLLRRLLNTVHIRIEGEPLVGMQIMGLEDSRVLDFDNLLILSLNERIFPKRSYEPSYIPPALRVAYGLPTSDMQDQSMAYHFYRLISRAKRLFLIYDSRTPDLASGEVSRYITQMQMLLPKEAMKIHDLQLGLSMGERRELSVEKNEQVMAELSQFLAGKGDLNFSASTLKKYIGCPLRFYLEKVKGLTLEEFDPEYMDASSYGTIMHALAQKYYDVVKARYPGQFISQDTQKSILERPGLEPWLVQQARMIMNQEYYNGKYHPEDPDAFFPGEGRVLANLMAQYLIKLLELECQETAFRYCASEFKGPQKQYHWAPAGPNGHRINFTLAIDRIDELPGAERTLRLIDYKTGSDVSTSRDLKSLVEKPEKGAIFQLFTYALAYHDLIDSTCHLQPRIYSFTLLGKDGLPKISINGVKINSLDDIYDPEKKSDKKKKTPEDASASSGAPKKSYLESFRDLFVGLIDEIFNPSIPFKQTEDDKNCRYCPFVQMCGRQKPASD